MVVDKDSIMNIMGGMENSVGVRLHNHRKKLRQRFDIRKKLGQGTYGKVQLGVNKETGEEVAIKTIRKAKIETEADLIRIRREIQIMSSVQHPNIIHIYEVFENREKIVLVMEYAAGGELYDFLNKRKVLAEDEARRIFRQIATAVYYCHKHKICHRDLKLENILLDEDGNAKIADFGLSNVFGGTRLMETYCGSPLYASPEIVLGIPYHGPEVDCWSLGVLLYTLVYGAMPFDGSHFKRLVKQISEADYFEPKTPSPASPLIAIMLTVSSKKRADIVRICKHWWVNEGQPDCCFEMAEHLASQTPVRLDLLLSLAPPVSSENVVVTKDMETSGGGGVGGAAHNEGPIRSHSVDSIMKVDQKDLPDFMMPKKKEADNHIGSGAKRDLTSTSAAEGARASKRVARTRPATKKRASSEKQSEEASEAFEGEPLQRSDSKEQTLTAATALAAEAAASATEEIKPPAEQASVVTPSEGSGNSSPSEPSVEEIKNDVNGDLPEVSTGVVSIASSSTAPPAAFTEKADEPAPTADAEEPAVPPTKSVERRKSKIFETAEKFNNLTESKTAPEKNRKVFIPGVKVSDAKAAFERKSSLTPAADKKPAHPTPPTTPPTPTPQPAQPSQQSPAKEPEAKPEQADPEQAKREVENRKKVKDAVDIIGRKLSMKKKLSPLATNLSDSGSAGSPNSPGSPSAVDPATGMKTVRVQVAPNDIRLATIQVSTPQASKFRAESPLNQATATPPEEPRKSSKVEITLKSATLPRRKTSQPDVPLAPVKAPSPERNISAPRRASVGQSVPSYRSEVEHMVGGPDHPHKPRHQRSEVSFPVAAAGSTARIHPSTVRSASLEPESKLKSRPREHIIPIRLEDDASRTTTPPARPPVPPGSSSSTHLPYQRSLSARSTSLSRQSTQDSDTDSTVSASGGEPIRKSQREYIIPIAVEGGGYVTPRASSLEPGEDWSKTSGHSLPRSRLSRPKRMSSLFSESDDERESLNSEDRRSGGMDLHRLRSSRPTRRTLEHTDSLSSAEEEDDDEGFEILTAENLFSSLLSRVRSLTQRLNVEDGGRPGFPASRLLNQLHSSRAGSPFWTGSVFNRAPLEPLSRNTGLTTIRTVTTTTTRVSEATRSLSQDAENSGPTPWRRSVSRDTSDTESVSSGTIPRGRRAEHCNSGDFSEASYSYSPSVSECLSAPTSRRSSRDLATSRRYTGGFSSARRAARALEEELNQPAAYNRRLGRTLSMRSPLDNQEKDLPPLPYVPKRLSGYSSGMRNSTDGMTVSCPASTFSSREESVRSPSLLRSTSLSRDREERSERLAHERPAYERYPDRRASAAFGSALDRFSSGLTSDRLSSGLSSDRISSGYISDRLSSGLSSDRLTSGLTSDRLSTGMSSDRLSSGFSSGLTSDRLSSMLTSDRLSSGVTSDPLSSDRIGPERVMERPNLERFLSERPVTESSTLGRQSKGRRISRFLRPDFYDTPRESSIYAKKRDLMKDSKQEGGRIELKEAPVSRFGQSQESRIESTIRSLRESSLGPKEMDGLPTESSLLRRAVSVSDFTPNVKLAGYGDSSVPRRIPSYQKYTGTTSDTFLLSDGPNIETRNPPPSESISKITSNGTLLKKKKTSSKGTSSSIGKKRVTASPTKILDDTKIFSDNGSGVPDSTENKNDGRPAISDAEKLSKSPVPESSESVPKQEGSSAIMSKISGNTSSPTGAGTSKVRSLSKKSGSIADLTSATIKVRSGSKIGGTSDLSAVNGASKDRSSVKSSGSKTSSSAVDSSESTPSKVTKEKSSEKRSGSATNLAVGDTPAVSASKVTKERTSVKNSESKTTLAAIGTAESLASKVTKEGSSVKNSDSTANLSAAAIAPSTLKDPKELSSVSTVGSTSNLADPSVSKVAKTQSSVKSSGSNTNLSAIGTVEPIANKISKERIAVRPSGSRTNMIASGAVDSLVNQAPEDRSLVKNSGSTTNLSAIGTAEPVKNKISKERISVKTSGSKTDVADSSACKASKERSTVKISGSTTNLSGIDTAELAANKASIQDRSSVKGSGSTTNCTTGASDSLMSKVPKERSAIKSCGSRTHLATSSTSDLSSSKVAKERGSIKSNGSITNLAAIGTHDVPLSKVSKERGSSLKSGASTNVLPTATADPTNVTNGQSKAKPSSIPSSLAAAETSTSTATKEEVTATSNRSSLMPPVTSTTDSSVGTVSKGLSTTEASSSVGKESDTTDSSKNTPIGSIEKVSKLRSSVKSSRSKTNVSAVEASDALSEAIKERRSVKNPSSSTCATSDASANSVSKDSPVKSSGSSSSLSGTNKVSTTSKTPKSTSDATASPRRVRSITKMSDLSGSSLPKMPSLTRVSKNAENSGAGKVESASESLQSPTKIRNLPKPSGSMTDIPRSSPTKIRSISKMGSSTERLDTCPSKLRNIGTTKATESSTDFANSISKVPSASKLSRKATGSPRTVVKTPGSDLPATSQSLPDSPTKMSRSSSGLLPTENTPTTSDKVSVVVTPSVPPKKTIKPSARKSETDAKLNGTLRAVRSATESPSVSPTKRLFGSLGTSPILGKRSPPMPGQSSPRPVHRRNSISQPMPTRRSSSHNRRGRSSSSVEREDIPVISLKDVERRHRAMLLDRWSQSLQSLHLEREKAKAEVESKSEPKVELKLETKSEPEAEIKVEAKSEPKGEIKMADTIDEPKSEMKLDGSKGRIPRLSSQSALNDVSRPITTPPKVPSSSSIENRPKTLSLKISPGVGVDTLLSPCESETLESPHSAVTSPASEDMESVSDRIRRKSFYSRFNDVKKKKRSPSASASSLLPSYTLTSRSHYPIEYTRSLSCGISGPDKGRLYMSNGTGTKDDTLLRPVRKERSPSWERSNMEIQNDLLFHNLGLHRFDPNNLSTDKETLFGMLSPTSEVAGSALDPSNLTSSVSASDPEEAVVAPTKTTETVSEPAPEPEVADVVVTLPPPKSTANKT